MTDKPKTLWQYADKTVITDSKKKRLEAEYVRGGYKNADKDSWKQRILARHAELKQIPFSENINGKKHSNQCKYAGYGVCMCWCNGTHHGTGLITNTRDEAKEEEVIEQ